MLVCFISFGLFLISFFWIIFEYCPPFRYNYLISHMIVILIIIYLHYLYVSLFGFPFLTSSFPHFLLAFFILFEYAIIFSASSLIDFSTFFVSHKFSILLLFSVVHLMTIIPLCFRFQHVSSRIFSPKQLYIHFV